MAFSKNKFRIAVGSDHAGFRTKQNLIRFLRSEGHEVKDFGPSTDSRTDYPDYAVKVAKAVSSKKFDRGVLACGSGIGMCITANKVKGIRASAPWSVKTASLSSEHNWANVLCVSGRFSTFSQIHKMIRAWLKTPFDKGGRHERRVKKILKYESKS